MTPAEVYILSSLIPEDLGVLFIVD